MDSDNLREDVGLETEKTLTGMNPSQFALLLDDVSGLESLIPQRDHGLTLEVLLKRVYHEAGKRSIAGYEAYVDQAGPDDSDDPKARAEKALLENGLALNTRGEVVPIFPQT
jgi:hypothetical protein